METGLKALVDISNYYGKNPEFVLAGGGNTSFKDEKHLWVKASGTSLDTITESGFVKLSRTGLKEISEKNYSSDPLEREMQVKKDLMQSIVETTGNRPSVETSLHNLLNFRFVVHTHPALINGLMCSVNCRRETQSIFGNKALLVEYTDPGYVLFKLVEKRIIEYTKTYGIEPQIIFLENHGVFVSANTSHEIKEIYSYIFNEIRSRISLELPSSELSRSETNETTKYFAMYSGLLAKSFNSPLISEFTKNRQSFSQAGSAFTPDNIVYCKAHYLFSGNDPKIRAADFQSFKGQYGYAPKVIAIENAGIICLEENKHSLNTVFEIFHDMLKISWYSRNFGGPRFMTTKQIEFIDDWEVENYRRKVAKDK